MFKRKDLSHHSLLDCLVICYSRFKIIGNSTGYMIRLQITKLFFGFLFFAFAILGGCATNPDATVDPYESFNRNVFEFNTTVDKYALKPVAKIYKKVVPKPVSKGVSNISSNLDDATNVVHDLLQGRFEWALQDLSRFLVNSTVGLGGIFDVTDDLNMALPKRSQDTGITLARWGVDSGPYLMLPLLGPSTLRDAAGILPNRAINPLSSPYNMIDDVAISWRWDVVQIVDFRAGLLDVEKFLMGDRYKALRDTYLSQRHFAITGEALQKEDDFLTDSYDESFGEENSDDDW